MSKQLNVNLAFSADTGKAKAQIQDLQNTLNQLAASSAISGKAFNTDELQKGIKAAKELQHHLQAATDVNTGKLNLSAFSASLKTSGKSLSEYKTQLEGLGVTGQEAFLKVSKSIATAEAPLRKTNKYLNEFATTLKNTARWQISSSLLHGFMGSVQSAYRYAQDLNESLTDIRIVTSQSTEEMAAFAEKANRAAKALSTTTNQYAKASLIYYQQGLSDQEVQDRADITIKMAHASGQSAEIVSDQLTAVWNNFAKGGENLEHYADVMTALGAATASSSDEIAGGLEKFASIAEMIGLSYEYAASALATITATTRQSEDVVGTALKTIFARIQGLKLGETLDDGTDLNKYSEALQKVGISIFEQNGELKNMDNILDEMGAKWETLSKDQQVALAQTVAGVRQYNQLVSLMDSWDFMQENVALSLNSDGTLEEQAEIYAESWEGASNRVRSAMESIYSTLLDDKFFIDLTDGLGVFLEGLDGFFKGMGGMEGILGTIGAFITQKLAKEAPTALNTIKQNLLQITGQAHEIANSMQQQNIKDLEQETKIASKNFEEDQGSAAYYADVAMTKLIAEQKNKLIQYEHEYSAAEKAAAEQEISHLEMMRDMMVNKGKEYDNSLGKLEEYKTKLAGLGVNFNIDTWDKFKNELFELGHLKDVSSQFRNINAGIDNAEMNVKEFNSQLITMAKSSQAATGNTQWGKLAQQLEAAGKQAGVTKQQLADMFTGSQVYTTLSDRIKELSGSVENYKGNIQGATHNNKQAQIAMEGFIKTCMDMGIIFNQLPVKINNAKAGMTDLQRHTVKTSEAIMNFSSALMQANAFITSMKTLKDVFTNEDATRIEQVGAAVGALTAGIFMFNAISKLTTSLLYLEVGAHTANAAATTAEAVATGASEKAHYGAVGAKIADIAATIGLTGAMGPLIVVTLGLVAAMAVLVLGIGAVVKIFNKIKESTPEGQLKKVTEQAKEATKAFNEAKQAYDNLMNSSSDYTKGKEALVGLSKDSEEYKQKLSEVNAEALNLIETLGLINGKDYKIEDGLINIDDSVLKEKEEEAYKLQESAQANRLYYNQKQQNAELEVDKEKFIKNNKLESTSKPATEHQKEGMLATTVSGAALGFGIGGPIGAAIGGGLALIASAIGVNAINKQDSNDEQVKALEILAKNYGEQGEVVFESKTMRDLLESQGISEEVINALESSKNETMDLVSSMSDNEKAIIENTKALSKAANNKNDDYNNLTEEGQEIFDALNAQKAQEILTDPNSAEYKAAKNTLTDKEKTEEILLNSRGLSSANSKFEEKVDGSWELSKLNEDGVYEKAGELSKEEVIEVVVSHEVLQYDPDSEIGQEVDKLNTIENSLVEKGIDKEGAHDVVLNLAAGEAPDLSGLSKEDLALIKKILPDLLEGTDYEKHGDKISEYQFDEKAYNENKKARDEAYNQEGEAKATELGIDVEEFKAYRDLLKESTDIYDDNVEGLNKIALANKRMEKGVKSLADDWEDFNKIMSDETSSLEDVSSILPEVNEGLQDILNLDSTQFELLPPDFAQRNWGLIQDVMNNVEGAVDKLRDKAGQEILMNIEGTVDADGKLNADLLALHNQIASYDSLGFEVGVGISEKDNAEFINACQGIVDAAGMTAKQAQGYFASMGYDVTFKEGEETKTSTYEVPNVTLDPETKMPTLVDPGKPTITIETENKVAGTAIETITPNGSYGGDINVETTAPKGATSGKSKGGGGGSSKPAETVKYTDKDKVIDRYKEIDDTLSDIEDTMSDINKLSDRLYGASRISQMEKEKKLLLQQADALKEKKRQAKFYLEGDKEKGIKGDRQKLIDIGAEVGITWKFDTEDGDILNYTTAMEGLYNELHAAEAKLEGMATKEAQDEFKESTISKIEEKIEKVKDALSKYEDTKELIKELDNQLQEAIWAWQDKNFEVLEYKLELKLEINDYDLKRLDYLMNKWSDDFFKMAESAALMFSKTDYDQVDAQRANMEANREFEQSIRDQYAKGEISQEKYVAGLRRAEDAYYDQLNALVELDKAMQHYYEDTLAAASDELADYTDHMEHLNGVFDHYLNIMDLLGRSKDYEAMGDFLQGKADVSRDELEVAQEYYDMLLGRQAEIRTQLDNAIASGDEESIKYWQDQWDAIVDATDAAQEDMLAKTEAWIENMQVVIQNNVDKLRDDLEKSLTNGLGFDALMDDFDKLNARQEEYLTRTNQIYETNKLMREANKAIDSADNKVAKQKLQNFVAETQSLQENNKLSKYELEIQQAKYDLLLAEIALEEAQNAKSTVRMQRDSEGNFGYIYTADQDAISDAEQGVADAENRLYNLSLEGQQEYTEKYLQAQQAMLDDLDEIWQLYYEEHAITEEEYNERYAKIWDHYYGSNGILTTYQNLYNVAVRTDADATADNWQKDYGAMTQNTEEWADNVNTYYEEVQEQIKDWEEVSIQANKDVKGALDNSSTATKNLTSESDKLGREIINDLIPAMDKELDRIEDTIEAYDREREAIRKMREELERYIELIDKDVKKEVTESDDKEETTSPTSNNYAFDAITKAAEGDEEGANALVEARGKIEGVDNSGLGSIVEQVLALDEEDRKEFLKDWKATGHKNSNLMSAVMDKFDITGYNPKKYDTGGFTGVWGPEGKLAFLHQKELVLNEHDTENMLATVSMIRELVSMIDAGAAGSMISGLLSTPGFTNMLNHDFQQNVEIYAEFPSATDHTEIEQAFNNLLNTASQYANRK